jgi:hypothetical protein
VGEECIIGIADDFVVQIRFNQKGFSDLGEDVHIVEERLCSSFLRGFEEHLELVKGSDVEVKKNDTFFNIGKFGDPGKKLKKFPKKDLSRFVNKSNFFMKKKKVIEKKEYKVPKCFEIKEEVKETKFEFSTKGTKVNEYHFETKILQKLNLEDKKKKLKFRKIANLQKYVKLLKYHEIAILVRFDIGTFEFAFQTELEIDFAKFRKKVPGKIIDAIVNEKLGQLIILTYGNNKKNKYHVVVYNLISFMHIFEKESGLKM